MAKCQWRVFNSFQKGRAPSDKSYAEASTDARIFIILAHGLPGRKSLQSSSQVISDTFNTLMQRSWNELRTLLNSRKRRLRMANGPESQIRTLEKIHQELMEGPDAFQFWCWECTKMLRFIILRKPMYLRHGSHDDSKDEVMQSMENDEVA